MDLGLGADAAEFGARVRAFLDREMAGAVPDPADLTGLDEKFERTLSAAAGAAGLLGAADARHRAVFDYVVAAAGAPLIDTALTLAGHPLLHYGSPEQREYFLPRMLRGEVLMCIAYTEADAGTDLRALSARAVPDGGGYRLTGVKTLVTGAHKADWCLTIARTEESFTMFLVPMSAPGVSVRRRPAMNGWTLDEIVFDAVAVDASAVLGTPGGGWRQLIAAVQAERSGLFYLGFARQVLDLLIAHVRGVCDPITRDAIGALEAEVDAGTVLAVRAVGEPGLGSMAKIVGSELLQRLAQTATEIAGHAGTVWAPLFGPASPYAAAGGRFAWEYLERVHGTIGAGVNESLRDGIAQFTLGLPREGKPPRKPASPADGAAIDAVAITALAEAAPGYDTAWWRGALPSFDGPFAHVVAQVRRLAREAVPSPVHNGVVQSGALLAALGADAELAALYAGERRYAFCLTEPDGTSLDTTVAPDGTITGTKCFVPYAADADVLLIVVREGVFAVEAHAPGVRLEPIPTLGRDHQHAVHLTRAAARNLTGCRWVPGAGDDDNPSILRGVLARGTIALAADALGAAEAALAHTVARVSTRIVGGRPVGTRQSVQHRCADMHLDVTLVAGVVDRAARLVDEDAPLEEIVRAAAVARVVAADRCRRVTASAHQLGGGEGIHADQPLHLWYRRVKAAEPMLGSPRHHRALLADAVLDRAEPGADPLDRSEGTG